MNHNIAHCDRPTRLRKAILHMKADDLFARNVTVEDVSLVWPDLSMSGYGPFSIAEIANSNDINEPLFLYLMKLLNSRL